MKKVPANRDSEIRAKYASGDHNAATLAEEYKLSVIRIKQILRSRND